MMALQCITSFDSFLMNYSLFYQYAEMFSRTDDYPFAFIIPDVSLSVMSRQLYSSFLYSLLFNLFMGTDEYIQNPFPNYSYIWCLEHLGHLDK